MVCASSRASNFFASTQTPCTLQSPEEAFGLLPPARSIHALSFDTWSQVCASRETVAVQLLGAGQRRIPRIFPVCPETPLAFARRFPKGFFFVATIFVNLFAGFRTSVSFSIANPPLPFLMFSPRDREKAVFGPHPFMEQRTGADFRFMARYQSIPLGCFHRLNFSSGGPR